MDKDVFLERIRKRLGDTARSSVDVPGDWDVDIDDPMVRFEKELVAVDGCFYRCSAQDAGALLAEILNGGGRPKVLLTREDGVPQGLEGAVTGTGGEVLAWPDAGRDGAAAADVGVTSALWAVAETGSIVVGSAAPGGRAPSLLPPVHVAFVPAARLVDTTKTLFRRIAELPERPSNMVVITGPSKSADIGMELARGVHGPGEVHVVMLDGP